ncbi:hypothetical protein CCR94_10070 [Rhodoblastus sphagnicola]|uniref:DUF707 domain-containing protein n=1 Tax=Rhodoblastus sphagnicola TaxID=333368 RepID=A0A2S6N9C6_9HYPH|nr:hypothetical protein [Rhodoblastus sphagnicola]MBB4196505.1 hypothetical protein [Rhodoblastus sphagnicola]PPQ31209.1 hypothetical protein CCR94_10070 [Rhodoblastus sphagnicola]
MSSPTGRNNLVVVRAGKTSLHPRWLAGAESRNWDLIVSLYDAEAVFDHGPDVRAVLRPGGKWDGLHAVLAEEGALDGYDYILLPDDDLDMTGQDIEAIFAAMRRHDLDVAQPALSWDSYFSHFSVLACPGFTLRYVNFVEIMAPCLRREVLEKILPEFAHTMSGFGLDYVWCRLSEDPRRRAAILDSIPIRHTRPIGRVLRGHMAKQGVGAKDEEQRLRACYGLTGRHRPLFYAAIDDQGRRIEGLGPLALRMAWAYMRIHRKLRMQEPPFGNIFKIIRRQLMLRPQLSQLRRVADSAGHE